jgi:DMSO/TMAO reductase YedYZ molybdopterin-dependent catalytic subunit
MHVRYSRRVTLPPGQHAVEGFPRFGTHLHHSPPSIPPDPVIEIAGAVTEPFSVPVTRLAELPRTQLTADFHCVAGWSATGLRWEGVAFEAFYGTVIEPALQPDAVVTHVVFRGLDGYRSVVAIEDALADDVLIAERLDGRPLGADHGAPVRLVSPSQYGFVSTKHLCRIDVRSAARPDEHPKPFRRAPLIEPHPRARVWEEERHRYLPAWTVRPIYRLLVPPFLFLSARGSSDSESRA